jgi:penicillin-binding protein 1A
VRVENAKGDVLWEPTPVRVPVMSPEEAWLMVSMMKDVVQRGTAAGSVGSQFHIPAGGKTGTTNDGADVWFIGYTSDLVAGVWMGLDKPKKIKGNAQGGILAAPAWTAFMREVYRRKPAAPDWPRPEGIVIRQVDAASGLLWAPGCGEAITDYFLAGTDPIATCVPPVGPVPGAAPLDTSFGFPPPNPQPRPQGSDTAPIARLPRVQGGGMITQGAAPIPRASRPRPSRDSLGTSPTPRDSVSSPRDTSNPFNLPPSRPR